jgi:cellulose synthase/poly-beta-1,6-N-acetylglucosamine synthase-like glycosyltransferase
MNRTLSDARQTLDAGTKPEKTAIYELYECMEPDPDIGACCGEITTRMRASVNPFQSPLNPLCSNGECVRLYFGASGCLLCLSLCIN